MRNPAKPRQAEKLLEVAYASGRANGLGPLKAIAYGGDAITLASALVVARLRGAGQDGEWPTQAEYAREFGMTERNAQREWFRYRQVFGQRADPYVLARALLEHKPVEFQRLAELKKPDEALDLAVDAPAALLGSLALA